MQVSRTIEEFCARYIPLWCFVFLGTVFVLYTNLFSVQVFAGIILVCVGGVAMYTKKTGVIYILLSTTIVIACSYMLVNQYESERILHNVPFGQMIEFSAVISDVPDRRYTKQFLTVLPDGEKYNIRIRQDLNTVYMVGDRVHVRGLLEKPESFIGSAGKEFDYPRYLAASDIVAEISRPSIVKLGTTDASYDVRRVLSSMRLGLEKTVSTYIPIHAQGLALGSTLGSREYMSDEIAVAYQVVGISHIVVLSGFNISILAIILQRGIFLRYRIPRYIATLIVLAAVWGFIGVVGLSPSIVRAGVMLSLALFAAAFHRSGVGWRLLLYAAVSMVILNPRILLGDIGFQLSVAATAGLFIVAPFLEKLWKNNSDDHRLVSEVKSVFIATLATAIMTLPLLIYQIGAIAGWSVIVNIAVLWVIPFIMLGVLIVWLVSWSSIIAVAVGAIVGYLVLFVNTIAQLFQQLSPVTIKYNAIIMVASIIVVGALLIVCSRSKRE